MKKREKRKKEKAYWAGPAGEASPVGWNSLRNRRELGIPERMHGRWRLA
jgi:hypothetical protein